MATQPIQVIKRRKRVFFLTIKMEFQPNTEISGLEEFINLGLQFYIVDEGTGSPRIVTPDDTTNTFSVQKEGAFFGLLNKKFKKIHECITYASEIELRAVRIYGDKLLHFYRDWKDRSPSA